jgi:glycosyltransferase involved in cell wall biosynthesis
VSVVIPTFNHARFVVQAVDSALRQTVEPADVVVVDDGSTDDTRSRLAPYFDRIRYLVQPNQGVSAARNLGVRAGRGGFVAFLDSDDVWHPRKLERQMAAFDRHADLGLLGTAMFEWPAAAFPGAGDNLESTVTRVSWPDLVVRNYLVTSSVVVRRTLLERAGEFDTRMQGPEDRDLWLRVAEHAAVGNLDEPLTGYRSVEGSLSKRPAACAAGMQRLLQKLDERNVWQGRWLLRRKAYSYVHHSCAYVYAAAGRPRTAVAKSLRSLVWYPIPYRRREVGVPFERVLRLIVNLLRVGGLKPAESPRATEPNGALCEISTV